MAPSARAAVQAALHWPNRAMHKKTINWSDAMLHKSESHASA
ncbi:hypothetical protein [uncultured Dechloromonas sp.]|nr:hypothetical protein [uncultured Dechloromonas sp.]